MTRRVEEVQAYQTLASKEKSLQYRIPGLKALERDTWTTVCSDQGIPLRCIACCMPWLEKYEEELQIV